MDQLISTWATASPIAHGNMKFDPPNNSLWIKYYLRFGTAYEGEKMGTGIKVGVFQIEVNVPSETGLQPALRYCDRLETGFRNQDLSDVNCGETYSVEQGESGGFFGYLVNVPFWIFTGTGS